MSQQFVELINFYLNNIDLTRDEVGQEFISGSIDTNELYTCFLNGLKALDFCFSTRSCTESRLTNGLTGQICFESKRLGWQVPFCGSPYQVERKIYLECAYGKKYYGDKKGKYVPNPMLKTRKRDKPSKKIGCPAKMSVKVIRVFTDYAVRVNNWRSKREVLKADMESETPPESTLRFLISLSTEASHSHPIVPMPFHQKLHQDLVNEIHNLVQNGICTVRLIKSHLLEYVKAMFLNSDLKPDPTNCCYYPTNKIIYNHMRKAMVDPKNDCNKDAENNECTVPVAESNECTVAEGNECTVAEGNECTEAEGNECTEAEGNECTVAEGIECTVAESNECTVAESNECTEAESNECTVAESNECTVTESNECTVAENNERTVAESNECTVAEGSECLEAESNECTVIAEGDEYIEAESNEYIQQWVEIITSSSPLGNAQCNDIVFEDVLNPKPTEEASTLVSVLDKEHANSEVIGLQQSCKKELLKIDKLLHMCVDQDYLQSLLQNLEHLTNWTEESANQN